MTILLNKSKDQNVSTQVTNKLQVKKKIPNKMQLDIFLDVLLRDILKNFSQGHDFTQNNVTCTPKNHSSREKLLISGQPLKHQMLSL